MKWILEHIQFLVAVAAAIAYFLNRHRQAGDDAAADQAPRSAMDADELAERTRRVQEEIRRKIAARRGAATEATAAKTERGLPPMTRPAQVPPLDPFGGPLRRMVQKVEQLTEPERPRQDADTALVLERQARLAEQMRALEAARVAEQRRAVQIAAAQRAEHAALRTVNPLPELRDQLLEPAQLRRAVILQEVLGRPIALR